MNMQTATDIIFILLSSSQNNNVIEALKTLDDYNHKDKKYRWHDLRKNPDDLPKCEHVVDIAFEAYDGKINTARAFHEDGKMHTEDTTLLGCGDYEWDDWCEYCEETDDYIIPECWIESEISGENCSTIDRDIIAWREIRPFEEETE